MLEITVSETRIVGTTSRTMADKAVRTGKKVDFEPMSSYERKIIHNALSFG